MSHGPSHEYIFSRLCSVRVRTDRTHGIYPRYYPTKNLCKFCRALIPVPGTSVSSVRHSYPYPELLEILYARGHNTLGTVNRNFCEFCKPELQYTELLEVLYDIRTRTQNFWKFCNILIPLLGNPVTPARLWHSTRGTCMPSLQYPGSSVFIRV